MPTTSVDFGDVEVKLRAYMRATGVTMTNCVRRAVGEHIDAELGKNPGTKERFEEAMAKVVAEAGGNVSLLIAKRRKRGSA
jgi:hypothetical protein